MGANDAAEMLEVAKAEVVRLEALVPECDGGCSYMTGPEETCSLHGRPVAEVWEIAQQRAREAQAARDEATERAAAIAEQAGGELATVGITEYAEAVRDTRALIAAAIRDSAGTDPLREHDAALIDRVTERFQGTEIITRAGFVGWLEDTATGIREGRA